MQHMSVTEHARAAASKDTPNLWLCRSGSSYLRSSSNNKISIQGKPCRQQYTAVICSCMTFNGCRSHTSKAFNKPGKPYLLTRSYSRPTAPARLSPVCKASNEEGPRRGGRKQPWNISSWFHKLGNVPMRFIFNMGVAYLLMRFWPMGGGGFGRQDNMVVQLPYSEFIKRAKLNEVQSVAIDGTHINFSARTGSSLLSARQEVVDPSKITFYTVRPVDYAVPYELLDKNSVMYTALERSNRAVTLVAYLMFVVTLLAALSRVPLKLAAAKGPGRKHKAGGDNGERPVVTFADVAGVDEAKEELAEIVEYLRVPERFSKLGARPPNGVLLVGPPGTGKTLLAKAVAGEADVPFYSISASEFVELYVGMGAMRVRELFAAARKEAPCIVFIDEIDAVAKGRDMRLRSVGNDEREQTLNQLLTELDGFDSDKGQGQVICIAATNRPDVLDPALLRPGRFDRRVTVERPDRLGREQILKVHLQRRGLPLSNDVSVTSLASGTTGFTGADLANLVNEAALLAGRKSKNEVGREEFDAAILRAVAGVEKKRSILVGLEKSVVSKHEVGHALVSTAISQLLPVTAAQVEKLSIIPRSGGALGFTYIPPKTEDRALMFDSEIRGQLAMLMGGRAAEELTCTAVSTGAVDDIRRATDLAQRAVAEFGLSANIGPLNVGVLAAGGGDDGGLGLVMGQGNMTKQVEQEVKGLLEGALCVAMDVIATNSRLHEELSDALTSQERLEGNELNRWLQSVTVPQTLRDFVMYGKLPSKEVFQKLCSQAVRMAR